MGAPAPSPRSGGKPPLFNPTAGPKGSQQVPWRKETIPRAKGGGVIKGQSYLVGEGGPEIFVPEQAGKIISPEESIKILNDNKNLNFVDRILNKDNYPAIANNDGSYSTHLMSWSAYKGKYIVYPSIVWDKGKLKKLSPDDAFKYAIKNKEYISFDDAQKAKIFAAGAYKAPWEK